MQNFQGTFETCKQSFFSAFSIGMTVPLRLQFHCVVFFKKNNFKMFVRSRNFGHLVCNQQNCIVFYWYFYAEWKTVVK